MTDAEIAEIRAACARLDSVLGLSVDPADQPILADVRTLRNNLPALLDALTEMQQRIEELGAKNIELQKELCDVE